MSLAPLLILAALLATTADREEIEFAKDSLEVVKKNVDDEKAVLVEVRSKEEWNKGHIEGSISLPIDTLRKGGTPKKLPRSCPKTKSSTLFAS